MTCVVEMNSFDLRWDFKKDEFFWNLVLICFVPERLPKLLPSSLIHLKYLRMEELCFTHKYRLPFLVLLIRSSPNLEKLKLAMYPTYWLDEDEKGFFTLEDYSDIMLEHLNELEILNFSDAEN